jgi:hypothetical protein
LQASKTHQVSTLSLHGHTQQQVTDGADEFLIDFHTIFIHDSCSWHDGGESFNYKKKNKTFYFLECVLNVSRSFTVATDKVNI